jgi:hypothetical protein
LTATIKPVSLSLALYTVANLYRKAIKKINGNLKKNKIEPIPDPRQEIQFFQIALLLKFAYWNK